MPLDQPLYPANLVVAGRRCLVVGGGRVAAQKVDGLLECGADVHVVAPDVVPRLRAMADDATIQLHERPYRDGDLDGCWLAITATDDPAVNRAVFQAGEQARTWVNGADDPQNCSFTLPARIRRGPLLVTFATGGRSPAVALWLKRSYAEDFGSEHVTLIEMLADERAAIQASGRPTEGLDWQAALDSGMLDLIREGRLAEAKERLQACLS